MRECLNELQCNIEELQDEQANADGGINWGLVKKILSGVVELINIISKHLPASLFWLSSILSLVGTLLNQLIQYLPDDESPQGV